MHGQSDDKTAAEDQAPAVLKLESNLVVVRVIVRDAQGNPVKGLKREDFKLYDQSKEQSIAQFEEEPSDEVRLAAPSVQTPSIPATGTPGKTAMPRFAGPERFVALYFDDLDTSQGDMMRARDAADRFLAAGLQPNDRVAIFTTGGLLSDFTSDLKQIHDALFMLRPSVRAQASERLAECPELSDYQAVQIAQSNNPDSDAWRVALADLARCRGADANPLSSGLSRTTAAGMNVDMVQILTQARRIVDQAELQVRSNLQQFERVVKYVSQKPGEHTVILVSPGFVSESERPQLDRIIDIALRSQVVINSLDPRGLAVLMEEADASRGDPHMGRTRATQDNLTQGRDFAAADVLAEVAEGTGGVFLRKDNDLQAGFGALAMHSEVYTLAFSPKNLKPDGKFHALKVSLAEEQKGYSIQARRGYFAPANQPATSGQAGTQDNEATKTEPAILPAASDPRAQERDRLREAIRSKKEMSELPVELEVRTSAGQDGTRAISVLTHVDGGPLHFHKNGDLNLNTLTFVVGVFDQNGNPVQFQQRHTDLSVLDGQLPEFVKAGLNAEITVQVKPGSYRVREVVTDSEDHLTTALDRDVNVP